MITSLQMKPSNKTPSAFKKDESTQHTTYLPALSSGSNISFPKTYRP